MLHIVRPHALFPLTLGALLLSGCALQNTATPAAESGVQIGGKVHGGQQAVVGAHVHLLAAGTTGYGAASTSLLTLNTAGSDTYGGYVLTDNLGSFTITGDYLCTPGTQVYLLATGGNPGLPSGQTNSALALVSALGQCPSTGTLALSVPLIFVDEISTIGSVYAMAGYMTDLFHVSSSGTPQALTGIANAFANAQNLYGVSSGQALATTPAGNGVVPQAEINTLANILAPCINSAGPSSAGCSNLFANALNGTTQPTDTVTAALNIAHNPAQNVANLFALQTASSPYLPSLSQQPNDFTVALAFSGGGIYEPSSLALDGAGNPWIVNANSSISELNNATGAAISPAAGFTGNGLSASSYSIAIDQLGDPWVVSGSSVSKFTSSGAAAAGSPFTAGGITNPPNFGFLSARNIAFDALGNAWIPNYYTATVTELNGTTGVPLSGTTGYSVGAQSANVPQGIAIDSANHVWVAGDNGQVFYELSTSGSLLFTSPQHSGGIDVPNSVAIDASNNIWFTNNYDPNTLVGDTISKFNSSGAPYPYSPLGGGGLLDPLSIAIDGLGNAWIANNIHDTITEFNNAGSLLSPSGFTSSQLTLAGDIAIDASGNVWVPNTSILNPDYTTTPGTTVLEFVGAGAPTVTPIATAVTSGKLGTRP